MADNLKTMQNYAALGVNLSRGKYGPLDVSGVFYSLDAFKWYLSFSSVNPAGNESLTRPESVAADFVARPYEGQIVAVENNGEVVVYVLGPELAAAKEDGLWFDYSEVGSKTLGDNKSVVLSDDGILSIVGFADALENQVPYKQADGSIGWKAISGLIPETIATEGDGATIDVSLVENKYIITLRGKESAEAKAVLQKQEDGTYAWVVIYTKDEVDALLANKVDKETGKSLVLDTEIAKLAGISAEANKVEVEEKSGKIKIDGVEKQVVADNTVIDAAYKHITVTENSVSDGEVVFNKYDDSQLTGRVQAIEDDYLKTADKTALEEAIATKQDALGFEGVYNKETNKVVTKSVLDGAIAAVKQFKYQVTATLPEATGENMGIIWLYKPEAAETYEEFIIVNSGTDEAPVYSREKLGDTDIKLENYYTKAEVDSTTSGITSALDGKVDKVEGSSLMTSAEHEKLAAVEAMAQVNVIEGVKVNGVKVEPDENKSINITDVASASSLEALTAIVGDENSGLVKTIADEQTSRAEADAALGNRIKVYEDNKAAYDQAVVDATASAEKAHEHTNKTLLDGITADNLFSADERTKLAGVEAGAQVNKVEKIVLNSVEILVQDKTADLGSLATSEQLAAVDTKAGEAKAAVAALETSVTAELNNKLNSADLATAVAELDIAANKVQVSPDKDLAAKLTEVDAAISDVQSELANKVNAEEGKGLSTNDYTTAEKNKLASVAEGAQVNVIETIKVNGANLEVVDKTVDLSSVAGGALATKDEVTKAELSAELAAEIEGKVTAEAGKSLVADSEIAKLTGVSEGANKVEASEINGNIKIDGTETTVYTLPEDVVQDANYADNAAKWSAKQDAITADNKLSADLLQDGTANKVFTADEKTKLVNIAEGAQVNVLDGIQVAGNDIAITDKKANINLGEGLVYNSDTKEVDLDLSEIVLFGGNATL